jgi:hypothetical protein
VVVKGEGSYELESFHDDLAGAIGKAPLLIGVTAKNVPGCLDLVFGEVVDRCQVAAEELIVECNCAVWFATSPEQSQGFVNHII